MLFCVEIFYRWTLITYAWDLYYIEYSEVKYILFYIPTIYLVPRILVFYTSKFSENYLAFEHEI